MLVFKFICRRALKLYHTHFLRGCRTEVSSPVNGKNKVLDYIRSKIEATGPISIADYMKESLIAPYSGYYMKQDVFGSAGDFITSPEISQMFGELVGVWFCNEWLKAGRPQPLQFVEFGPGRGTLVDDVLRVFSKVLSAYKVDLSLHLIEISPHMKKMQMSSLGIKNTDKLELKSIYEETFTTKHGYPLMFHPSLKTVPDRFSLFLAHEFFDALPIHKFQKTSDGWREILLDFREGELTYVLSRNPTPAAKFLIQPNEQREHVEICPEAGIIMEDLCKRMEEDGGISLIIDYGHDGTKTDTFRSFKHHKLHDPLKNPGEADLTADVDFAYLKRFVEGRGYAVGPVSQAHFLKNMGIDIRLERLVQNADSDIQKSLKSGYDMLIQHDQMGERFKFLAIFPQVLEDILKKYPPAGF